MTAISHTISEPGRIRISQFSARITAETLKPESPKPTPFLKEQQELSALFEPEKVAHYFLNHVLEKKAATPVINALESLIVRHQPIIIPVRRPLEIELSETP